MGTEEICNHLSLGFGRIHVAFLGMVCLGVGWITPSFADHGGQVENPDGSFTISAGGEVEVEFIFSKDAFRNVAVITWTVRAIDDSGNVAEF